VDGLCSPVVTAAAACIVAVFLGFAVGQLLPVKAMGVGMVVAEAPLTRPAEPVGSGSEG